MKKVSTPLTDSTITALSSGDEVSLSGVIYTARDAAHKRLIALIENAQPLPVNLTGQVLYYTGPTPARPGTVIGSAGPTTSSRMDAYTPQLLAASGLKGMIGKGDRSDSVIKALHDHTAVYFAAVGGAGALLAQCITSAEVVCYADLGPEAIYKLEVHNFPLIVAIDSYGNNLYTKGPQQYRIH